MAGEQRREYAREMKEYNTSSGCLIIFRNSVRIKINNKFFNKVVTRALFILICQNCGP